MPKLSGLPGPRPFNNKKNERMNEKSPPTKKHERMVKHIKRRYAKDGNLTNKEKNIAYATAWKDYNK